MALSNSLVVVKSSKFVKLCCPLKQKFISSQQTAVEFSGNVHKILLVERRIRSLYSNPRNLDTLQFVTVEV